MSTCVRKLKAAHDDERLAQLHCILLMMMDDFMQVCKAENITWVGMYGTAIGALRHQGFIPWDDDIDICMTRSELERFCKVAQKTMSDKYAIINSQTCDTYPMSTTRLVLKGTEFRDENLATMDFDSGIFLDLFALDNISDDEAAFKKQSWNTWFFNKLAMARDISHPYIAPGGIREPILRIGTTVCRGMLHLPYLRSYDFNAKSLKWAKAYEDVSTKRVAYLCDTTRFSCIYNKEDLFPVRWVDFEDIQIPIARRAEKLLEEYYGDWQTPPDESMRHEHYPDVLDFGDYKPRCL